MPQTTHSPHRQTNATIARTANTLVSALNKVRKVTQCLDADEMHSCIIDHTVVAMFQKVLQKVQCLAAGGVSVLPEHPATAKEAHEPCRFAASSSQAC